MKNWHFLLVALALFACIPLLKGDDADDRKVQELMKKKLQHAQKVLEGIAVNDPKLIATSADNLMQISKAVQWRVLKTPRYEQHSDEFRRGIEALAEAAKAKNIDGAALAYVDVTLTCVRCHKYVRDVRQTRLAPAANSDLALRPVQ
jgi:hypothetical protein